jgi:hypothetical protein
MTDSDPAAERLRAAFASLADRIRPTEDCPSPETLWSAVRRELPPEKTRETARHAILCAACGEAWRLARDIAAEALPAGEPETEQMVARIRVSRTSRTGWWVLAAAVLVAAVFLPLTRWVERPESPGIRGPIEEPIWSLHPAGESLPRDRFVLRWAGPEGARYDIRVATEDLRVLARTFDLKTAEYHVPEEALSGLPAGAQIVWQVKAVLPNGERVSSRAFLSRLE